MAVITAFTYGQTPFTGWTPGQITAWNAAMDRLNGAVLVLGGTPEGRALEAARNAIAKAQNGKPAPGGGGDRIPLLFHNAKLNLGGADGVTSPEVRIGGEGYYSESVGEGGETVSIATELLGGTSPESLAATQAHEGQRLIQTFRPDGKPGDTPGQYLAKCWVNAQVWTINVYFYQARHTIRNTEGSLHNLNGAIRHRNAAWAQFFFTLFILL